MMAPLSDRRRWGIDAGASLGHHHARDYRRPMWAPGSHNPGGGVLRPPNDRRR